MRAMLTLSGLLFARVTLCSINNSNADAGAASARERAPRSVCRGRFPERTTVSDRVKRWGNLQDRRLHLP